MRHTQIRGHSPAQFIHPAHSNAALSKRGAGCNAHARERPHPRAVALAANGTPTGHKCHVVACIVLPWRLMARHLGTGATWWHVSWWRWDQAPGCAPPTLGLGALVHHPRRHRPVFSTQARVLHEFPMQLVVRATTWGRRPRHRQAP